MNEDAREYKSTKGTPSWKTAISILALIVIVFLLWLKFPWFLELMGFEKPENAGVYGDQFGALNALFSGLAFAILIITVNLQWRELALQRQELEKTRQEFRQQTELQDKHIKLLREDTEDRKRLQAVQNSPKLMLRQAPHKPEGVIFLVFNGGAPIYDIKVINYSPEARKECRIDPDTVLGRHEKAKICFDQGGVSTSFQESIQQRSSIRMF